jgi:mono/diheme cytochrome c family protein
VTEIPEHLLKRSRERRAAAGLPSEGAEAGATGDTGADAPKETKPAVPAAAAPARAAATPATPAAPPPKPEPEYVQAAKRRKKIPFWAMPVVALLPVWVWIFVASMQKPEVTVVGPLAGGAEVYAKCASCHGTNGEGGVGYQLNNGEVLKSFTTFEQQVEFIYNGNKAYIGQPYGSGRHQGGQRGAAGAMPAWGSAAGGELSDVQILEVVCHERYTLGGGDQTSDEFTTWCSETGEGYQKVASGGFAGAGLTTEPGSNPVG